MLLAVLVLVLVFVVCVRVLEVDDMEVVVVVVVVVPTISTVKLSAKATRQIVSAVSDLALSDVHAGRTIRIAMFAI